MFTMTANTECGGPLALRLMRGADEGKLRCGDCINLPEQVVDLLDPALYDNDNKEIARSQHEAAYGWALLQSRNATSKALRRGLADRLRFDFKHLAAGTYPKP